MVATKKLFMEQIQQLNGMVGATWGVYGHQVEGINTHPVVASQQKAFLSRGTRGVLVLLILRHNKNPHMRKKPPFIQRLLRSYCWVIK